MLCWHKSWLHLSDDAVADLHQLLLTAPGTELAGMKPHMRRALQALHTNTHFRVVGQTDRVHTTLGSRPVTHLQTWSLGTSLRVFCLR